jgi:hypothetical protein
VTEGDGPAFQASGRLLEASDQNHDVRMRLVATAESKQASARTWDAAISLIDAIVQREWTGGRSLAVIGQLRGLTQSQTASLWRRPIRQSSVAKHLSGAIWRPIGNAIDRFEHDEAINY